MDELNLMNLLLFLASQNSSGGSGGGVVLLYTFPTAPLMRMVTLLSHFLMGL